MSKQLFENLGYAEETPKNEFTLLQFRGEDCRVNFCNDRFVEYHDLVGHNEISLHVDEIVGMVEICKELGWVKKGE